MKTKTYDFRSFCQGELVCTDKREKLPQMAFLSAGAAVACTVNASHRAQAAVPAMATQRAPDLQHAFDPVITMLQQMAFPVASIVLAWACLQAMIGKPAGAVDRAKWAIIGFLAMRYAPDLLRQI